MAVFRTVALLSLLALPTSALTQTRDPLAGAWELVSTKNLDTGAANQAPAGRGPAGDTPLRVIFADGYYVQFAAAKGRETLTVPNAEMTKEQLVERYRLVGQYGTYKITGNKIVRNVLSAVNPNNEGREVSSDFKVQGDVLTITGPGGPTGTAKVESTYKRLRPTS